MTMAASPIVVCDSSPLVASCQCAVDGVSVAARVIAGVQGQMSPVVYDAVVIRGGARPDACKAARCVHTDQRHRADATSLGEELEDWQYYGFFFRVQKPAHYAWSPTADTCF